jgi:hypothetical protein
MVALGKLSFSEMTSSGARASQAGHIAAPTAHLILAKESRPHRGAKRKMQAERRDCC